MVTAQVMLRYQFSFAPGKDGSKLIERNCGLLRMELRGSPTCSYTIVIIQVVSAAVMYTVHAKNCVITFGMISTRQATEENKSACLWSRT